MLKIQQIILGCLLIIISLTTSWGCKYDVSAKIEGVPRRNFKFNSVSPSLAFYNTYEICSPPDPSSSNPGLDICVSQDVEDAREDITLLFDRDRASQDPHNFSNYVQALIMLVAIGIFFAFCAFVACCCGCCVKICCLSRDRNFKAQYGPDAYYEHSRNSVILTYFCLILFIFTMFVLLLLGLVRGNAIVRETLLSAVNAPDEAAVLVKGLPEPFLQVAISFLGTTIVQGAVDLRNTVDEALDINNIHESFNCVRNITDVVNLDTFDFFAAKVDEVEAAIVAGLALPEVAIQGLKSEVNTLGVVVNDTLVLISDFAAALSSVPLSPIVLTIGNLQTNVLNLQAEITDLSTSLENYQDLSSDMSSVQSDINVLLTTTFSTSNANQFQADATLMQTTVGNLDSGTELLNRLDSVTGLMGLINADLTTLLGELGDLNTAVSALPSITDAESLILNLTEQVTNLNLDFLRDALLNVTNSIPDVVPILDKFDEILATAQFLPCILNISDVPQKVNDDLVELPANVILDFNISGAEEQLDVIIDAANQIRQEVANVVNDLGLETAIDDLNDQINSIFDQINLNFLDVSGILSSISAPLDALETAIGSLDVSGFTTQISDLQDQLLLANNSLALSAGERDSILDLDGAVPTLTSLSSGLVSISAEFASLSVQASYECEESTTVCFTSSPQGACTTSVTDECKYPHERLSALKGILDLTQGAFDADILPIINDAKAAVDSFLPVISAVDFNNIAAVNDLLEVQNQLDSLGPDLSDLSSFLQDALNEINNFLDLSDLVSVFDPAILDDIRNAVSDVRNEVESVLDVVADILRIEQQAFEYLTIDIPELLNKLDISELQTQLNQGVSDLLNYIIDTVVDHLEEFEAKFEVDTEILQSIDDNRADIDQYVDWVDTVRDTDGLSDEGSYFYFYELYLKFTDKDNSVNLRAADVASFDSPQITGHILDGEVVRYSNDALCLIDTCVKNTIVYYDSSSAQDLSGDNVPFKANRSNVMSVPYIFGFMVVGVAICVFCFPCVCGNILAICSVGLALFLFLVFGGVLFPVVVVGGDGCASVEPLASTGLSIVQPGICSELNGTISSDGFCVVSPEIPGVDNFDLELDFPALFRAFAVSCDAGLSNANVASGPPQSAVSALYAKVGSSAVSKLGDILTEFANNDFEDLTSLTLRQELKDVLLAIEPNLANNVNEFVANLDTFLGCSQVSLAYSDLKDPICCGAVSALYYGTAMWYAIAFALLCCGCPAGCLAPSRLRDVKKSRETVRLFVQERMDQFENTKVGQTMFAVVHSGKPGDKSGRFYMEGKEDNVQMAEVAEPTGYRVADEVHDVKDPGKNDMQVSL